MGRRQGAATAGVGAAASVAAAGFRRGGGYADPGDRFAAEAGPTSGLAAEVARLREQVQALVDRLSRSGD